MSRGAESDNQLPGKQTLESLNPGLLEPFLPNNWEKTQKFFPGMKITRWPAAGLTSESKLDKTTMIKGELK